MRKIHALIEQSSDGKSDYTLRVLDTNKAEYVFLTYLNYEQYKDILKNKNYEITVKEVE